MKPRLFEFEDLHWFPSAVRTGGTDYLQFIIRHSGVYQPAEEMIDDLLKERNQHTLSDLCSGSGGPLVDYASRRAAINVSLSDRFPPARLQKLPANVRYTGHPFDCTTQHAEGSVVTMFSAMHHFDAESLAAIIRLQARGGNTVAFFDGGDRSALAILAILLLHPPGFLIATPFLRPFTFSRLLLTYIIPLIPFMTIWDGCVSILRLHRAADLKAIADSAVPDYCWEAGRVRRGIRPAMTYLVGKPRNNY